MLIFSVYNRLPANIRYSLKKLFRTAGHSQSWLDGLIARRDAKGKKGLASSLAHTLGLLETAGVSSLQGFTTMDFGAGYVPTDAITHWLLGAERSCALDYNHIANFDALRLALAADDAGQLIQQVPVQQQELFAQRLAMLRQAGELNPEVLARLGIIYQAPFDILGGDLPPTFDMIVSTSVLEHIASQDIPAILAALANALTPGGLMIHEIHLEDHLDIAQDPFNFFRIGTSYRPGFDHDARGNRVLRDEWRRYFTDLDTCSTTEAAVRFTTAAKLPPVAALQTRYQKLSRDALFASHLVNVSRKNAG